MALELRLVDRDVLDADAGFIGIAVDDAVNQQEWITVRQKIQQFLDINCR